MILDLQPIRDGDEEKAVRVRKDSSSGATAIVIIISVFLIACGTSFGIGYALGRASNISATDKLALDSAEAKPAATTALPEAAAGVTKGSLRSIDSNDKMSGLAHPPEPVANASAKPAIPKAAPTKKHAFEAAPLPAKAKPAAVATAPRHMPPHTTEVARRGGPTRGPDPFTHLVSNPDYGVNSMPTVSHQPMVQVAVLMRDEDASILIDALSRHGYSASANRESDHRIHIRLGPFSNRTDASAMRDKLLNDGYNAVVQ